MSAIPQTTEEIRAAVQARAIEIQGPAEEETTPQPRRPLQVDLSQFSGIRYLREYPPAFDWLLDKSFRLNSLGALVGLPARARAPLRSSFALPWQAGLPLWTRGIPPPLSPWST